MHAGSYPSLPRLSELGLDLLRITPFQRWRSLTMPFVWTAIYFLAAFSGYWLLAIGAVMALSFVTYGSISHDLVHRNLGLSKATNDMLLSAIELLTLRSGHAYRMVHLHHHREYPGDNDIEGAASRMSFVATLVDGLTLQFRIYRHALDHAGSQRRIILLEGWACCAIVVVALALIPLTPVPIVYVALVIAGSWIIPFITSYIPHDPAGHDTLHQTRRFRGVVLSVVALEHLYHLEHHLYPAVPHHHWPRLARRLDPYLDAMGIEPINLWF